MKDAEVQVLKEAGGTPQRVRVLSRTFGSTRHHTALRLRPDFLFGPKPRLEPLRVTKFLELVDHIPKPA
jgi:hypothetical protein